MANDEKIDVILEKYLEDKRSYEETIEHMNNEDYQRWLALIRPEYMDKYIQSCITDVLKRELKLKVSCDEIGLLNVSVNLGNKAISSDSYDLLPIIGRIVDDSK